MYQYYGARGIHVCRRWKTFANFLADMGERPPGYSLERKNVNKGYSPANCEWIPQSQQAKNRRWCHLLTFHGRTMTVTEWSREVGIPRQTLMKRLKNGWPVEAILTVRPKLGNKKLKHALLYPSSA